MSAPRSVVLAATAVVASPVVMLLADGDVDPETALVRVMVCAAVSWAAIGLVWSLVVPAPPVPVPTAATAGAPGAPSVGAAQPGPTAADPPGVGP